MQNRDRRTLFILAIGICISIAAYLMAMANWFNIEAERVASVATYVGLSSLFVTTSFAMYNRFAAFEEMTRQSNNEVFKSIEETIRQQRIGSYIVFGNTNDALDYVFRLLDKAKRVWNTRFSEPIEHYALGDGSPLRYKQDEFVAKAMSQNGCHYELIVSESQRNEITGFSSIVRSVGSNGGPNCRQSSAEYSAWILGTHDLPILQMIIIEMSDGSREALIGWIQSNKRNLRPSVVLFRDSDMVRFFLSVFEIYKDNAERFHVAQAN